jgi:hypothetical protein
MSMIVVMNPFSQVQRQRSGSDQLTNHVERAVYWSERRQPPAACAACRQESPPYVYLENQQHYCVDCALVTITSERIYPAGQRAEDITLADLLRDRFRVLPSLQPDRPAVVGDVTQELKAS